MIAGNWKMYKTQKEAQSMVAELLDLIESNLKVETLICPPFTVLTSIGKILKDTSVGLGAQNVYWEDQGAYTGEVSARMLVDCGCTYVIVGHSERRQYFKESNEIINLKVRGILKSRLSPILCVGETLNERERGEVESVICKQLKQGLNRVGPKEITSLVVAYEPIWAIGTGQTATPETAQEVHAMIREALSFQYSESLAAQIRILYGGSVNAQNISDLMAQSDLDGALVGGASLDAQSFATIVLRADTRPSRKGI